MADHSVKRRAHGDYEARGQVKITRRCPACLNDPAAVFDCQFCDGTGAGRVEYQDVPQDGIELYDLDGVLSSTYPAGFAPGDPVPLPSEASVRRWRRLITFGVVGSAALAYATRNAEWLWGAIVWTDKGQEKLVDTLDPATRAAQVTAFFGAWGSSATAPAVGNTTLGTELAEARVATTISQPAVNTIRWLWEVTATGNRIVNEAGVLTASTAGDLWLRLTLSTLNIETGDRAEFTVDLAFKDISE